MAAEQVGCIGSVRSLLQQIIPEVPLLADFEYTVDGKVAVMRFNRPEKLNAITYEMLALIEDAAKQAGSDPAVRSIVLTGVGRAFSAGTDLQQLSSQTPSQARAESYASTPDPDRPAPWTFPAIKKPVIAAVNGVAVGLGVEFTLQCDLRIAAESARFGWVFVHRGLVPDTGAGTYLLSQVVGLQNAAQLLFSGEIISAQRAKEIGYVLDVVPDAELMERAMGVAHAVSKGGPLATGQAKRLLYQGLTRDPIDHLKDHTATMSKLFASDDFREGVQSFIEHREPEWKGT
ncbi:MAG: enoyl-CoA hydratase-related protein [Dehalococcoidia bacterium]|nr:enoyl-CoA hydratase-related protein [Dehalococcoidia bacterium]